MGFTRGGALPLSPRRQPQNRNRAFGNVIGCFFSDKMQGPIVFESHSERRFLYALELCTSVRRYFPQPLSIPVPAAAGGSWDYTPDVLVEFADSAQVICEIKSTAEERAEVLLGPRGLASTRYAAATGLEFRVCIPPRERETIATNIALLMGFRQCAEPIGATAETIRGIVRRVRAVSIGELTGFTTLGADRGTVTAAVYHLLATGQAVTDLSRKLGTDSTIGYAIGGDPQLADYIRSWWQV